MRILSQERFVPAPPAEEPTNRFDRALVPSKNCSEVGVGAKVNRGIRTVLAMEVVVAMVTVAAVVVVVVAVVMVAVVVAAEILVNVVLEIALEVVTSCRHSLPIVA